MCAMKNLWGASFRHEKVYGQYDQSQNNESYHYNGDQFIFHRTTSACLSTRLSTVKLDYYCWDKGIKFSQESFLTMKV